MRGFFFCPSGPIYGTVVTAINGIICYYCLMISKEDIQKLAELSRIKLTDTEMESLQKDISNILDYVGQVSAVSAGGDALATGLSKASPPEPRNVMRDDVPYEEGSALKGARDAVVAAFPKNEKDYNVVRKIIQKDE